MKKLHYGIISAASIVPRFVSALNESKHSRAIAIGSSSLKRSEKLAKELKIPTAYGSYLEIYEDPKIDIVYIANINENHFEEIINALNHGKHVLCEKPFVLDPKQVSQIFDLASEKNLFVMEAQKAVFLPTTQYVKKCIENKKYGKLNQIQVSASFGSRFEKGHWMYDKHQGGALFGSGSYIIEYLLYLLDDPSFEYQALTHLGDSDEIDDVAIQFKFNQDLLASTHLTTRTHTHNIARFHFDDAIISIKNFWKSRKLKIHYHDNQESDVRKFSNVPEMVYEIEHVYDCIMDNKITSPYMTKNITEKCVTLVDEIYQTTLEQS